MDGAGPHLNLHRPDLPGPVPAVVDRPGGWQRGDRARGAETRLKVVAAHGDAAVSADKGALGGDTDQSSAVQATVHRFGPTDVETTATRSPMEDRLLPPVERAVFGPGSDLALAALERASNDAPPVLIVHGDRDCLVPICEPQALGDALSRCGAPATFVSAAGAGHGDPAVGRAPKLASTAAFLQAALPPSRGPTAGPQAAPAATPHPRSPRPCALEEECHGHPRFTSIQRSRPA